MAEAPELRRRVRIVVLNFNGGTDVVRCVDALAALDTRHEVEIVVVDNASSDGSLEAVALAHPEVEVRSTGANLGFVANNRALADLDAVDYVALVNNDAFVDPGWLDPLVESLEADPTLGAVQSRIVLAPRFLDVRITAPLSPMRPWDPRSRGVRITAARLAGADPEASSWHVAQGGLGLTREHGEIGEWTGGLAVVRVAVPAGGDGRIELRLATDSPKAVQLDGGATPAVVDVGPAPAWAGVELAGKPFDVINNVGGVVLADGSGTDRGWLQRDEGQFDEPAEIFTWCGGSVLLRPAYLADCGLFAEDLFLYYEDTDLAWRGRSRGWHYRYEPRSTVRHVHAASSGVTSPVFGYHTERNRLLVLAKHAPARLAWGAALRHPRSTASYLRRDVLGALRGRSHPEPAMVTIRLRAFAGFLRLLPAALAERRRIDRRRTVPRADVEADRARMGGS